MKRFVTLALALFLIALLLLPLGCAKKERDGKNGSSAKSVLAKSVTVNGFETPNRYAWYYHLQKDGSAMLDRYVDVSKQDTLPLPEKVDGYTVKALARDTFRDEDLGSYQNHIITIPDCLTEIEGNPFNTRGYFTISVSASHPTLEVKNGALFDKRESRLICAFNHEAAEDPWIPEGTKIIEDHAFRNVIIGEVHIPASVEKIGQNPFGYRTTQMLASQFWKITVAEDNPYFKVHDGALFDEREHRLISVSRADMRDMFSADTFDRDYIIPDGTKKIDDLALEFTGLNAVTIPASVGEIEINPFTGAREIRLASGNPRFTITGGVLYDTVEKRVICCEYRSDGIQNEHIVTIPEDAEIIGGYALSNINYDFTLPDSVREIGEYGICNNYFSGYDDTPVIHIPKTVRRIGMYAIRGYRVEGDRLELNGGVELGTCAFSGILGLTDTAIGDGGAILHAGVYGPNGGVMCPLERTVFGSGETVIGRGAFSMCARLESVGFSEGLALIGENAFYECRNLMELKLPKSLFWTDASAFLNTSWNEYNSALDAYMTNYQSMIELVVFRDSYAEQFAKLNDLTYRYAD